MCLNTIFHFQILDTFHSRGYRNFTPIVEARHNREELNCLHGNSTVNRLIYLLRMLPEVNSTYSSITVKVGRDLLESPKKFAMNKYSKYNEIKKC